MLLDVVDDAVELIETFGGLGVEVDAAVEVKTLYIFNVFHHNGSGACLSHQSENLRMSALAKDNDLAFGIGIILSLDPALQGQYHGACCIDDLDVVFPGQFVGFGRFTMGAEQHFHVVKLLHLLMIDGNQAMLMEPVYLHTVVHDVA